MHLHFREDEVWYVLEGDYRFKVGDAMFRVSEGGMAFGPRGTPASKTSATHLAGCWSLPHPRAWSGSSSSAPSCYLGRWMWRHSPPLRKPTGLSLSAHRSGFPIRYSYTQSAISYPCLPVGQAHVLARPRPARLPIRGDETAAARTGLHRYNTVHVTLLVRQRVLTRVFGGLASRGQPELTTAVSTARQ